MFGFSTVGDLVAAAIMGGFAQNTQLPGFFGGERLFQYKKSLLSGKTINSLRLKGRKNKSIDIQYYEIMG
jgi:hypothetical protein